MYMNILYIYIYIYILPFCNAQGWNLKLLQYFNMQLIYLETVTTRRIVLGILKDIVK